MYGQEVCDEVKEKWMTEEPSREWESMKPQAAAYPEDMSMQAKQY